MSNVSQNVKAQTARPEGALIVVDQGAFGPRPGQRGPPQRRGRRAEDQPKQPAPSQRPPRYRQPIHAHHRRTRRNPGLAPAGAIGIRTGRVSEMTKGTKGSKVFDAMRVPGSLPTTHT